MSVRFSEKMKAQAQTRLWVKWKYAINGHSDMVYHSFENAKSLRSGDRSYGLKKLIKMIESNHLRGKYDIAIIYDTKTGEELIRYKNDILMSSNISNNTLRHINEH